MEEQQTTEVRKEVARDDAGQTVTKKRVSKSETVSGGEYARQVVYYIGGLLVALIALRFILQLFGASEASGFVNFIYSLSNIFVTPFNGIFGEPTYGSSHFDTAALVAIVVYGLITIAIGRLFTLGHHEPA